MNRTVKILIPAFDLDMGGVIVKQALPTQKVDQVDPFLLLHHGELSSTENALAKHQGIGPHPHRGFSPVTFVIDGEVHHRDSRGNNQVAKKGEVQWMHAGAGIIHSERPSQALVERNGNQHIIQLWINSPAASKMKPPTYQFLAEADMPVIISDDQKVTTKLVAGHYSDKEMKKGRINTESDLLILWGKIAESGTTSYEIPVKFNAMIYVIRGTVSIGGYGMIEAKSLAIFDNNSSTIPVTGLSDAEFLILSGAPINEQVVQHGPFVMNSETEILEAMRDYQMGKMGVLIEE